MYKRVPNAQTTASSGIQDLDLDKNNSPRLLIYRDFLPDVSEWSRICTRERCPALLVVVAAALGSSGWKSSIYCTLRKGNRRGGGKVAGGGWVHTFIRGKTLGRAVLQMQAKNPSRSDAGTDGQILHHTRPSNPIQSNPGWVVLFLLW